jgi:hypothetical protein
VTGEDVENWQFFLRGRGLFFEATDGTFGPQTKLATQEFQRLHGLLDDGVAGNRTLGEAMRLGFSVVPDDPAVADSLDWPPPPNFSSLGASGRVELFGSFDFKATPVDGNPEAITIAGNWVQQNIVTETIPELAGITGASASGKVQLHRLAAPRVKALFAAWREAGLLPLILTYAGSFAPRFVRGKPGVLSPHAHGSAFDINVAWNGFGAIPAQVNAKGSVRKLVPIANDLGFYWGGHFTKRDGMHFEIAKLT